MLERPHAPRWLYAIAIALALPSLAGGLMLDDHVLRLLARTSSGVAGLHADPLFLFSFTDGRPEDNHALMDQGVMLPWWTTPQHLNAFFRPLSSLTHVLDFALYPTQPWLMHLHSLGWLLLLLSVAAHVYRGLALGDAQVARLAFAIFALDGGHVVTAAWIANRNALCATALALPALLAQHRFVTRGSLRSALLGPLCFALGLCAGETAVAIFGYLLAYTIVLDRAPLARRLLHLAPYLVLLVALRLVFARLGLGSAGSAGYHDPGREPLAYAFAVVQHLPVLLFSQLALPVADLWFWGPPELHLALWLSTAALVGALALAAHVLIADDPEARFWSLGMLLSAAAVAASVPGQRLLLAPSVGAAVFCAKLIAKLLASAADHATAAGVHRFGPRLLSAMFVLHLFLSPLAGPIGATSFATLGKAIRRVDADIPAGPAVTGKSVIVLNPPFDVMVNYIQPARAADGRPRPQHLNWLANATSALTVTTLDARTLRVRPERGFLFSTLERHYRADARGLGVGTQVELGAMQIRITELTPDQRPAAAEFEFREPLRSPRYLLRCFVRGKLREFVPGAPGTSVHFPRQDFFLTLLTQGLGLAL